MLPGRRLLVVTNPAAGGSSAGLDDALGVLRTGADVRVCATASTAELAGVLDDRDGRELVVAGGDGSLHHLVQALHDRGELAAVGPLGLLPLGTGNDFARTLRLPPDPAAAATVVLSGRPRPVDLLLTAPDGRGREQVAVNAVHLGVGAEMARTTTELKPRLGAGAYAVAGVLAGVTAPGWWVRVEVDGAVLHAGAGPVLMVGLGNGRTIGGGAPLAPSALPDDGLVDVVVSRSVGALERLAYAVDLRSGEHVTRDDVVVARGRTVVVRGEEFRCNSDGEVGGPFRARSWRVAPAAYAVRVPADG